MDPGLIKLLEDDEDKPRTLPHLQLPVLSAVWLWHSQPTQDDVIQKWYIRMPHVTSNLSDTGNYAEDENGPSVSGAAVDAYTERLKGVLGDGGSGATAAYAEAQTGSGSLKPLTSSPPTQIPTNSSVPPATGTIPIAAPSQMPQVTTSQWQQLTKHQQQAYIQRLALQRQHLQQPQQQHSQLQIGAQAPKRQSNISQGISFGALMPLLQPHLPPEQAQRLAALYQRFKQNEITREDFVRGARVIVGDQVLVQTIRQMHMKQQAGSQQPVNQQQARSQQSGSSTQLTGSQQSGESSQPATPSGSSTQPSPSKPVPDPVTVSKSMLPSSEQSLVLLQAHSLQQQQQHHQEQHQQSQNSSQQAPAQIRQQQSKGEPQPNESSQSSQLKSSLPLSHTFSPSQIPQNNLSEQTQQVGDLMSQGMSQQVTSPTLHQVKHEVEKASGPAQPGRPLQITAMNAFCNLQARPPTLPTAFPVGGQAQPGLPSQIVQPKPAYASPLRDHGHQADQKPLSKYAKAKLRKEQKKHEEEERLRRQQIGSTAVGSQPQAGQTPQPISLSSLLPQPHQKLLESKQQGVQTIMAIKRESRLDQYAGGFQRATVQAPAEGKDMHTGQMSNNAQLLDTGSQTINARDPRNPSAHILSGEQSHQPQFQASGASTSHPGSLNSPNQGAGSMGTQVAGAIRQANQQSGVPSPQPAVPVALNSTSTSGPGIPSLPTTIAATRVPGSSQWPVQVQGPVGASMQQSPNASAKAPYKKITVVVGQKKSGEAASSAGQPASKKLKTQGVEADQSIDQLNDVTAVSGVNLKEEEEQLLVGPKEESRTTEAMRKFVQEEEDRLFLERGPLRARAQAIATKCGVRSLNEDIERCLSMSAEERLRSMMYRLIKYSRQRCDSEKDMHNVVITSDPRRQVVLMKKRAKEAMDKKQAEENERLRKLNEKKDKGALADGDEDLRLKAQKAQQEEDDKMRAKAANVAARAAVGATDMLSKWQMMAAQGLAKRQGGDSVIDTERASSTEDAAGSREQDRRQDLGELAKVPGPGRSDLDGDGISGSALTSRPPGPGSGAGRCTSLRRTGTVHTGRQYRTITLKDVIALLEREPQMSKSVLLFKLYERECKSETSRRM